MNPILFTSASTQNVSNQNVSKKNVKPHREPADGLLIQRCKSGDRSAWNELIQRYQKDIYRYAYSLSHDREDAEDVASQVYVRLYQSLHTFHNESGFRPWLMRIIHRTFLDLCIRPMYRSHPSIEYLRSTDDEFASAGDALYQSPSPETLYLEKEANQILSDAKAHLPSMQRLMLSTYEEQGKSYQEIAEENGLPIGTIKSRINRARRMVRDRLVPYQDIFAST